MTATHFTAWLVNAPSCLDTEFMDVAVIEDEAISYKVDDDGAETPVWASQGDRVLNAVTTVSAKGGDIDVAKDQAEDLLKAAGWQTVGDWDVTDNAYIVTVERV